MKIHKFEEIKEYTLRISQSATRIIGFFFPSGTARKLENDSNGPTGHCSHSLSQSVRAKVTGLRRG